MKKIWDSWLPSWGWVLAFRHLRSRHSRVGVRWINAFAFGGVLVGVFAWTLLMSLMSGLQGETRNRILEAKAHWLWEGAPSQEVAHQVEALKADTQALQKWGVISVDSALISEALLELPDRGERARALGSGVVVEGRSHIEKDQVLLGEELFNALSPGGEERLMFYSAWDLKIQPFEFVSPRIFRTGIYQLDRTTAVMSLQQMQEWLGLDGALSLVEVKVADPENVTEEQREFLKGYFGVEFQSWKDRDAPLWYSLRLEKFMMALLLSFVLVMALVALNISMIVRVHERAREAALIRGLGADAKYLARVFMTEAFLLSLVASTIGLVMSFGVGHLISHHLTLPDIYYSTRIPMDWNGTLNLGFAGITVVFSVLVSYLPSRRLHKLEVSTMLRS